MRPSVDQPSRGSGSGRQLRRWAPIVAIVVVVAVVAVVLVVSGGDDKKTKTSESKATGAAPAGAVSFNEAKAKGIDATFPKTCDQQTGRVAIPFYFAPECFANVKDNGGAPRPGASPRDTIKVVVYSAPENDPIINFITAAIKNSDTRTQSKQDTQAYDRPASAATTRPTAARCRSSSSTARATPTMRSPARADAVKAADEMGAFAVLGGPALTTAFADELAARKVICICTLGGGLPEWYQQRAPYVYTVTANATQGQVHLAEYITKQLAGATPTRRGDPAMHGKKRVVRSSVHRGQRRVGQGGGEVEVVAGRQGRGPQGTDPLHPRSGAAAGTGGQLDRQAQVGGRHQRHLLRVIPWPLRNFTSEATRQDYFPEWIIGPHRPGRHRGVRPYLRPAAVGPRFGHHRTGGPHRST